MPTVLSHGMLPLLIWALSSAQSSSLVTTSGVTTSSITRSSSCRSSGSCHRHCPPSPSSQSSRTSSTRLLFPSSQSSSHHYNNNDPSRIRRRGNNSRSFTVATFARGTASAGASAVANPDSPISNHTKNYNTIESLSTETTEEDDVRETTTATTTTPEPNGASSSKLDLPRHIAFICDGNSRWARRKSLPESMGHVAGAERVVSLIRTLLNYPSSSSSPWPSSSTTTMQQQPSPDDNESMRQSEKQNNDDTNNNNNSNNNKPPKSSNNNKPQRIEYCTLFAFSTENWSRPPAEIAALFAVVERAARRHRRHDAVRSGRVQFELLGNLDDGRIPSGAREELRALEGESRAACGRRRREAKAKKEKAKAAASDERRSGRADDNNEEEEECNVLTISLAINYGGRADLLRAAASLTRSVLSGDLPPSALDDPAELSRRLCTADLPDPDLIVRTGGERRLSNFLLWEAAYAELYFTEDLWPEFDEGRLEEALGWYGRRKRNFGGR